MWRWVVLWQATGLLLVSGFLDFGFFSQKSRFEPTPQMNCYEYLDPKMDRYMKMFSEGWRYTKPAPRQFIALPTSNIYSMDSLFNTNELISRKIDRLLPETDDVVKEHAKLVQDINGLKQVVFVSPFRDESRDYDDSIFNEIIETSTTPRPTSTKPKSKSNSIPIILLGGASQRQVVKSQPLQFSKPTINLVGTTSNPLLRHPYPFVIQSSTKKPIKLCMPSMQMGYTTRRPSLWSRLINSIIPR